jgi:hypothetical protein
MTDTLYEAAESAPIKFVHFSCPLWGGGCAEILEEYDYHWNTQNNFHFLTLKSLGVFTFVYPLGSFKNEVMQQG